MSEAVRAVLDLDARLRAACGDTRPETRRMSADFAGLARVVAAQQVSAAAARTVSGRLTALGLDRPEAWTTASPETVRATGLGPRKAATLRAVALAVAEGRLDFAGFDAMPDAAVAAALTAIPGIGPWTTDIFLLMCLGRPDIFPSGDYALRLAYADLIGMAQPPSAAEMLAAAEAWRPWRSGAAHVLWHLYKRK